MSLAVTSPPKMMTAEELMALPEDGIHRELIQGQLRERPNTVRNRRQSEIEATLAHLLRRWLRGQPKPCGKIHSGEAGFRIRQEPVTLVGVDVAYASAELVAKTDEALAFHDGPPVLAVEILSPSDTHGEVVERVGLYLEVGTVVWVVDPDFRTVTVHRPGRPPEMVNNRQDLVAEPYLPCFRLPVAEIFGA
jgi:Uma2 family endonuclease